MRTILLVIFATTLAAAVTAIAAQAAPPPRALLEGSEIRRNAEFGGIQRYEVLELAPDGTFTGNYQKSRPVARGSAETWAGSMRGRWTFDGVELCFEGVGLEYEGRSCYRLTKGGYARNEWSGIQSRTGDVWQFFITPR
jgi:hypothetical protein